MSETQAEEKAADPGRRRWTSFFTGAAAGLPILVFVLGVITGFPIAIFGFDFLIENAAVAFAVLFGLLFLVTIAGVVIIALRKPIWQRLFRYGEVELHRMAEPLGEVVRLTSERRIPEATVAASDLARFVMARYAWIATRRWIIGAVTGFVAVIAALAGSALLFQQNQLLRIQGELMRQQTERLTEQTRMLETQIQLGEAQRSTSIVPEILSIGAAIAAETASMPTVVSEAGTQMLSLPLRARIVAATLAARPYRYLSYGLDTLSDDEIVAEAIGRRTDLPLTQEQVRGVVSERDATWKLGNADPRSPAGELTDRIVSPERGQILGMLYNGGLHDITRLTYEGADFAFAEVRHAVLDGINLSFAKLDFADFSRVSLAGARFGAARLDHARFIRTPIVDADFGSIPNSQVIEPFTPHPLLEFRPTRLVGADFSLADIQGSRFTAVQAISANFDGAALIGTDFSGALLLAVTFRNAILYQVDFSGADLTKTDFDGAVLFEPDFLDRVGAQVVSGSFDKSRYRLEEVTEQLMATHPNLNALVRLPADVQNNQPPLRLVRIAPIEAPAAAE